MDGLDLTKSIILLKFFFFSFLRVGFWLLEDGFAIVCTLVPWAGRWLVMGIFLENYDNISILFDCIALS